MKTLVVIVSLLVLASLSYPQQIKEKMLKNKGKLEQLEKIKLMEVLDLNEDESIRFFSRRNESRKEINELEDKLNELIEDMEDSFDSDDKNIEASQKRMIGEIITLRENIELKRKQFIESLPDILTTEQICKFLVFEKKFKEEIRNVLLGKKHM